MYFLLTNNKIAHLQTNIEGKTKNASSFHIYVANFTWVYINCNLFYLLNVKCKQV